MFQSARRKLILPFLLPGLAFIVVFFIYPVIQNIGISFSNWNGIFRTNGYVGWANYSRLWEDPYFLQAVRNTFLFFGTMLVLMFPIMFLLAIPLHAIKRGKYIFQFMIIAPVVLSVTVAAVLWKFLYNPNMGLINSGLEALGLESITRIWLGDSSTVLVAVSVASIWHGIGTWVVLLIAGLDRISPDLHEAASIDGATGWQSFWKITFPLVWDVLKTLIILAFIGALQTFSFIYIMTDGGPQGNSEVMGSYLYKMAFTGNNFAYGAAMALVMAVSILVFSFVGNRLMKRDSIEY
ncbi:carbohydrate ABC transporter permease [Cohnella silvisoli]|uniref:Sugar ABC transporter permease n=1 Tax=Cohnella silvisoli TaxID=2873699 RepID=A0ABV1L3U0_9BACL|nr:sugar ABC transporter permease [Cohnella silvisoli]MCD9026238.1 sugar ABC transporter permease [Cohnella silvisoli]